MIKPPGFDPSKKYPLKILDPWRPARRVGKFVDYRWNAELFAASGNYVVVMINLHGHGLRSEVYRLDQRRLGRQTVCRSDEGARLRGEDLSVHRQEPRSGVARATAVTWRTGSSATRIGSNVSYRHDGMFNAESAYGTTEELFFRIGNSAAAVEKTGCLSEMVASRIRAILQNADARLARATRLPPRCIAGVRSCSRTCKC